MPAFIQTLTIFLIKPALESDAIVKRIERRQNRFFEVGNTRYTIYSKRSVPKKPQWASFFDGLQLPESFIWESDSPGVLLLLSVDDRTFAISFGQGRHLLQPDCYEEQFGLRVVLNSVDMVRSIDKKTFDAISGQTRTQAGWDAEVSQFGFDIEKDLLRAVTGTPIPELGIRLSGVDALTATVRVELDGLPELLRRYLAQSKLTVYRERGFAFVDHMRAVTKLDLRAALDQLLVDQLETGLEELRHHITPRFTFELIIPDVIDFADTQIFSYSRDIRRVPVRHDVSLTTFLTHRTAGWNPTSESLRRAPVYAFSGDGQLTHTWQAYKCLVGDLQHNGSHYVLNDGNWYEIGHDYIADIDNKVAGIPRYEQEFPLYSGGGEAAYNANIAATIPGYFNFDRQLLHPISQQKIEFCDLYAEVHNHKDLIHVKHGTSSAVLSHLFAQGTVASEVCADFEVCKNQSEDMIRNAIGAEAYERDDRPDKFRIVYAIIRPRLGNLFFFSKVNLWRACRNLNRAKVPYALAEIAYDPVYLIAAPLP